MSPVKPHLVIDTRERAVIPFIDDAVTNGDYTVKQITVGDFAICRNEQILASFERKTLEDFAASFHDARYENIKKMIKLRETTGCKLFVIVEGPAFPSPGRKFHRVPYANILAAMTKLMIRDDIFIIQTENEQHTAKRLADILRTYEIVTADADVFTSADAVDTTVASADAVDDTSADEDAAVDGGAAAVSTPDASSASAAAAPTAAALLTERFDQTLDECVVNMWMQLTGISLVMSKVLANKFSIAGFMLIPKAEIKEFKTATGRKLKKEAISSLEALHSGDAKVAAKLLSGIRGITSNVAMDVIHHMDANFANVCRADVLTLSKVEIPQKNRTVKLGAAKANKIINAIYYTGPAAEL